MGPCPGSGAADRHVGCACPRRGGGAGRRPPRHQAREHHAHERRHDEGRDFGIARRMDTPSMTVTCGFVGTMAYGAPEQMGGEVDHRTDIYALGATLYCMLTGRPPYGGTALDVLQQHRDASFPPLRWRDCPTRWSTPSAVVWRRCRSIVTRARATSRGRSSGHVRRSRGRKRQRLRLRLRQFRPRPLRTPARRPRCQGWRPSSRTLPRPRPCRSPHPAPPSPRRRQCPHHHPPLRNPRSPPPRPPPQPSQRSRQRLHHPPPLRSPRLPRRPRHHPPLPQRTRQRGLCASSRTPPRVRPRRRAQ